MVPSPAVDKLSSGEGDRRLRACFDLPIIGIGIVDSNMRFVEANDKFCDILGFSRNELLRLSWPEIAHPDDMERSQTLVKEVLAGEREGFTLEKRYVRKSGIAVHGQLSIRCLRDEKGAVESFVVFLVDISERKAVEEAQQRVRELEFEIAHAARLSTIGELMTGIVHELNQPLSAISNFASACRNTLDDSAADVKSVPPMLDRIVEQAHRASSALRQILDFARMGIPHRSTVDLEELINDAVSLMEFVARRQQVTLLIELEPDLPPILVDRIQIQQVILNLLRNACEALAVSETSSREVWIRTRVRDEFIEIMVEDNGPGIRMEDFPLLFNAFFTTRSQGVGIGLAISKTIVEGHDGQIEAENNPDGGAVFRILLPMTPSRWAQEQIRS